MALIKQASSQAEKAQAKENLINPEYFKIIKHYLIAYNNTSKQDLLNSSTIILLEIEEGSLTFTLPKGSCSQGHSLTLFFSQDKSSIQIKKIPYNLEVPGTFAITGKVKELNALNERFQSVKIKLSNFVPAEWKSIQSYYLEKQKELSEVITQMKGFGQ